MLLYFPVLAFSKTAFFKAQIVTVMLMFYSHFNDLKLVSHQNKLKSYFLLHNRYKTALKEIRVLRKLRDLNWFGVPKLYGACVAPNEIMYAVSRVKGTPLCSGVGANSTCLVVRELNSYILHTSKPTLATLTFLSKVRPFFARCCFSINMFSMLIYYSNLI